MELITKGYKYHTNTSFPFIIFKNNMIDEIKKVNNRYKLLLINKGKFIVSINNKSFLIKDQSIIILNEKDVMEINEVKDIDYHVIYFHPCIINAKFNFSNIINPDESFNETDGLDLYVLAPFTKDNEYNAFHLSQLIYRKIEKLFLSIYNMLNYQEDSFWPCKSRSYMIELLFILRTIYNEKDNYKNLEFDDIDDDINKVIIFIHLNYDKKITIKELAKTFYTNRTTLSNKFKEKTGLSIINYINKLRIDIACQMLRDTNCIIEDIADRTGFSDVSNFGRTFKRYTGFNPTKYRNQFEVIKYY